jgi:hypothetical protein
MAKRKNKKWYWYCNARDGRHGCFSADYDGHCMAKGRQVFATKEAALAAGAKHRCFYQSLRNWDHSAQGDTISATNQA